MTAIPPSAGAPKPPTRRTVLVVDDDRVGRESLGEALTEMGYRACEAPDAATALRLIEAEPVELVLTDLRMPEIDGIELLQRIRRHDAHLGVILITAYATVHTAVEAMKLGAFGYVQKPIDLDELAAQVQRAFVARDLLLENISLRQRLHSLGDLPGLVGSSPAMKPVFDLISQVADSESTVLIRGESGTGKELVANAIHGRSSRSGAAFVKVNCAAITETLLESELFGHEEGAFTGATRARRGAFELAHGGTIFLDEVGDMPLHLQVKLLRVLQDRQVQRVGGEKPFDVNVRVMAASNRNLADEVEEGRFRKDLYYRLSVVTLEVPPLRQRKEDIPALARSYVEFHRPRIGREVHHVDEPVIDVLCRYNWPGNIRELINVIERAMLLCRSDTIALADLPAGITGFAPRRSTGLWIPADPKEVPSAWLGKPLKELRDSVLAELERTYLAAMLAATGGKVGETAERAGMEPRSLYDKMKQYGLAKEDFRPGRPKPTPR